MRPLKVVCILLALAGCSNASPPRAPRTHQEILQEGLEAIDRLAAASELISCGATPDQVRAEYGEPRHIMPLTWSEYIIGDTRIGALVRGPYVLHIFPFAAPCEELPQEVVRSWPPLLPQLERELGHPVRTGETDYWIYSVSVGPPEGHARFGFFKSRAVYIKGRRSRME